MAKDVTAEDQAEQARVTHYQKQAAAHRATEVARRAAHAKAAKTQESLIVHGPAQA